MENETIQQRTERIISQLKSRYPGKKCYDLDGRGLHFVCEIEPTDDHPEYDLAAEVIILSKPHKHLKTKQVYTILSGSLEFHEGDRVVKLLPGDRYNVDPGSVHWAKSDDECLLELYSRPGWTKEDHIAVD